MCTSCPFIQDQLDEIKAALHKILATVQEDLWSQEEISTDDEEETKVSSPAKKRTRGFDLSRQL